MFPQFSTIQKTEMLLMINGLKKKSVRVGFYRNPLPLRKEKGFDKFISQTMFGIVFVLWWKNKSEGKTPGHCPQISFLYVELKFQRFQLNFIKNI